MTTKISSYNDDDVDGPAPLKYSMGSGVPGSYDDLKLKPKGGSTWRHPPSDVPDQEGPFWVPQGTPLPLKDEVIPQNLPKDSMFVLDKNQATLACCPATFSTDKGCVCTQPEQRQFIAARRGNNNLYSA